MTTSRTASAAPSGMLYCHDNARDDAQRQAMRDLDDAGVCVFCPPHFDADPAGLIRHRTADGHWTVTENAYPYAGTQTHLLLVPRAHVTDLLGLSWQARDDMWRALRWIKDTYQLGHYGLGARCGDMRRTGGTVAHTHVHVIAGGPDGPAVHFKMAA